MAAQTRGDNRIRQGVNGMPLPRAPPAVKSPADQVHRIKDSPEGAAEFLERAPLQLATKRTRVRKLHTQQEQKQSNWQGAANSQSNWRPRSMGACRATLRGCFGTLRDVRWNGPGPRR